MADTSLRDALSGLNVPAAENYWGIGATTLGEIAPKLINPYGKVGTNLGIGLGSVLLTALLGYQARQTAAEESITTNKLANELMSLNTPEQRLARIEQAKGEMPARLTSRVLEFNTALQGQEKLNALDVARQKALEEAKLEVEMSPLGEKLFNRQIEKLRQQQSFIGGRQQGLEATKQVNRLDLIEQRANEQKELLRAKARIDEAAKSGTLNTKQSSTVQGAIEFGNAAEDFIEKLGLENMPYATFQAKMKDPALFGVDLTSELEKLKAPYRLSNAGTAASASEMKNVDMAFGITNWSSPQELVTALRGLKEARAKAADSAIATASMKVPDLYKGIQTLRTPGARFTFEPLQDRFSDMEAAIAPQGTEQALAEPAPNTTPAVTVSAEAQAAIADINRRNISEAQKEQLRQKIIARDRGQ